MSVAIRHGKTALALTSNSFTRTWSKERMRKHLIIVLSFGVFLVAGCKDRDAEALKAKEAADAKARADAAKKEMETIPNAFQTPDYFKKNDPKKKSPPTAEPSPLNH